MTLRRRPPAQFEYSSFRTRAIYHIPLSPGWAASVGGGWVHNRFTGDINGSSNGLTGLLGIRAQVADLAAITGNVIGDYNPSPVDQLEAVTGETFNWGVELGLQVFVLGGITN